DSPFSAATTLRGSSPFDPITQMSEFKKLDAKTISEPSGETDQASAPSRISRGAPPSMETIQTPECSAPKAVACANSLVPSGNQPTGDQPVILYPTSCG